MSFLRKVFGHPLHAILSDFPIVLMVCGVVCDVSAVCGADGFFWQAGRYAGWAAMAFAVPTVLAGLWELRKIANTPVVGLALWHACLMATAVTTYGLALLLRGTMSPALAAGGEALALLVGMGGAWCGGHLVFAHGVGVERGN